MWKEMPRENGAAVPQLQTRRFSVVAGDKETQSLKFEMS